MFNRELKLDGLRLDPGPLALRNVHFGAGVQINLDHVSLDLEGSDFAGSSLIHGKDASITQVRSLERADVGTLVLSAVDLRSCRFVGAHNLDRLRLEDVTPFCTPPVGWHVQAHWPPIWRWTKRQVIAEEFLWRLANDPLWIRFATTYGPWLRPRAVAKAERTLPADEVAKIYRALRKGREDNRDSPGAADFYYGEMEMRRRHAVGAEKLVLTFYWLLSGYALRSSRAIIFLAITRAVSTVLSLGSA